MDVMDVMDGMDLGIPKVDEGEARGLRPHGIVATC
jgi:hypothetical protein